MYRSGLSRRTLCRCFSKLSQSDEAIRQGTMGWTLDPENPVAPETPILESIFNDQDIFTKDIDYLEEHKFPTPQTPFAGSAHEIKGCVSSAVGALFSNQLLNQCKTRKIIPNVASLYFFPSWHPIAHYRKSRPALAIVPRPGLDFNGNSIADNSKNAVGRKKPQIALKPLDMAVWRQVAGRRFRSALFEKFSNSPHPLDGLYVVMPLRVPSREEATALVSEFTTAVAQSNLNWAKSNAKLTGSLAYLKHNMLQNHIRPPQFYLDRELWL